MASAPNFLRGSTPRPGDRLSSKTFADLSNASTAARQSPRSDVFGTQTAGGFVAFPPANVRQPSATAITPTPFEIFAVKNIVDGTWDGTYNVTLYPGSVNELLPSNIFSTINQTIGATQYVVLTCMSDGYSITSMTWSLMSSQPTPPDATADAPPSEFYIILGVIFYNSGTSSISIYQIVVDDLSASPSEWTRTTRSGAGPYDLAYVIYYYWNVT